MEFGIGAVVKSTLYKPLAENNDGEISRIIISTRNFYKKIAFLLVIYSLVLCYVIPNFVAVEYDWAFSASLTPAFRRSSRSAAFSAFCNDSLHLIKQFC